MSKDDDNALEKLLTSSLSRAVDWLKFAETKNAALLTFSSAWIIGLFNYLSGNGDQLLKECAAWGIPFFVFAAGCAVFSFAPRVLLGKFYTRKLSTVRDKNLLFFGDLKNLELVTASTTLKERYTPKPERSMADSYIDDLSVQLVVISRIAYRKFQLFDVGACSAITAFLVMMAVVPLYELVQHIVSVSHGP